MLESEGRANETARWLRGTKKIASCDISRLITYDFRRMCDEFGFFAFYLCLAAFKGSKNPVPLS